MWENASPKPNVATIFAGVHECPKDHRIAETVEAGGNALFGANYPVDEAMIRITPVRVIGWGLDPEAGWSLNRRVEHR